MYFGQWPAHEQCAVIEATACWYWLCDLLRSLGIRTVLAHAKYLKAISYAKVKTDAVDAHTLAQLLRLGYVPEAHQLPGEYRAMRDLLRQRMVMEHKRTNLIQRISSILAQFNVRLQVSPSAAGFAAFLEGCGLPVEYRMTLLMYHQQCIQATEHRKRLEKHFKEKLRPTSALQLHERTSKRVARTVVAKELAKIVYYVLHRQQEFKAFKGVAIDKLRDWPRARKLDRVRRSLTTRAHN